MIVVLIVLAVVAFIVERWSIVNALNGVGIDYGSSVPLAAPDEVFDMVSNLTNKSRRFVPFIKASETLPAQIKLHSPDAKISVDFKGDMRHSYTTYLMPRSALRRVEKASISQRGRYMFNSAMLSGGDFLGLNENVKRVSPYSEIVIYPKEYDSGKIGDVLGGFLGDVSVRRFIMEDPVLTAGFREYTGREPMKAISWSQSARAGKMMVRSFDYTTEPSVTVLLNVECSCGEDGERAREALIETSYSMTHTVCKILEERRVKYDFYTNATSSGAFSDWSYISEGLGKQHFYTILEGMGRASYRATEPFASAIKRVETRGINSIIIITPTDEQTILPCLSRESIFNALILSAGGAC
ncbi:MAG: DUF58 domain-containing protein [Oscillospiraceae bacterium]|nr:DUF58 domain-containing protein [Oscillospiraceae bacterium]